MRTNVILDTNPGLADAMASFNALQALELEALGRSDQEQAWHSRRPAAICMGVDAQRAGALKWKLLAQG